MHKCLYMDGSTYVPFSEHVVQFFCMVSIAVDSVREENIVCRMLPDKMELGKGRIGIGVGVREEKGGEDK